MVGMSANISAASSLIPVFSTKAPAVSGNEKDLDKAKTAAQDFEAFFLTRMMESMFDGISTDGPFGGGNAEKMYRSLLLDEYGKEMAKLGGIGVQDQVMRTILEMQEMAQNGYIEA